MILLPQIDAYLQERKQNQILSDWTQANEARAALSDDRASEGTPQHESAAPVVPTAQEMDGIPVLGSISINRIELREPLLQGSGPEPLDLGIGVVETGSSPGEEWTHVVLAGHRSLKPGKHFNRLGELEQGDLVQIESASGTFRYRVARSFLVEPDDLSVLTPQSGETLTLITCHPMRNPTHRLIVKATPVN